MASMKNSEDMSISPIHSNPLTLGSEDLGQPSETGNNDQNSVLQMSTMCGFCQECTETNADSIQKAAVPVETQTTLAPTEHVGDEARLPAIPEAAISISSKSDLALSTKVNKNTRGSSVTHLESATKENKKVTTKSTSNGSQSNEKSSNVKEATVDAQQQETSVESGDNNEKSSNEKSSNVKSSNAKEATDDAQQRETSVESGDNNEKSSNVKSSNVKEATDDAQQRETSVESGDNGTRRYSRRERQTVQRPDFVDITTGRLSDMHQNVVMEECTKPPPPSRKPTKRISQDNLGESRKRLKRKEYGIDPRVLDRLPLSTEEYQEESSYRYHNPPFPHTSDEQLAVIRDENIPGNMRPVDSSKLTPLQNPPPIPRKPESEHCNWTYDETSRVLLADFKTPAMNSGRVVITREDEEYLLKMMERDDITVISEGLADEFDLSLLGETYVESRLGSQFHHKVKEFRKTSSTPCGIPTGEIVGQYEEKGWHSMKFKDYFNYLSLKEKIMNSEESVAKDEMFTFKDSNGKDISIDISQSVLYLLDLDMVKFLPRAYENFTNNFKLSNILPGGAHCMMNAVNVNGRPFMGPNLYMTPPSSFTQFHQDGHGTVDSGHYCCRGYNEVVMLRRLPERHKHNALHLLHRTPSSSSSYLYEKPHDVVALPWWPTTEAIEQCKKMGYCPSVFILKPGQLVHINKGRLHAFRKLSPSSLHAADCHYSLREAILPSIRRADFFCLSVAWDWMYKGVSSEGINREVSSILECARLNQKHSVQSLAIPETSLLFLAQDHLGLLKMSTKTVNKGDRYQPDSKCILRGILPSLQYVIHRHRMTEMASMSSQGSKHKKVSIDPKPNTHQNPDSFSMDPHGSGDFICKFCSDELSNIYMHCDGCERLLNKDFNICPSCHSNEKYKERIVMHPFNPKMKSDLNHTGIMNFTRHSRCPCKNGPACTYCSYCIGCSCTCHQMFTLHYRFMPVEDELGLLKQAVDIVGKDVIATSLETKVRMFSLLSEDLYVPVEAFANDGVEIYEEDEGTEAHTKTDTVYSNNFTESNGLAATISSKGTPPQLIGSTQLLSNPVAHQSQSIVTQDEEAKESANSLSHTNNNNEGSGNKQLSRTKNDNEDKGLIIHNGRPKRNRKLTSTYVARPSKQGLGVEDGDTQAVLAYVDKVDETCPRRHVKSTRRGTKRESSTRNKTVKVSKCSQEITKTESQIGADSLCGPSENENHISQADLDALQPGSRVLVYKPEKKCAYWNATVKERRQDEQKYHFLVHFDGHKNNPKKYEWVEEDAIARIGID